MTDRVENYPNVSVQLSDGTALITIDDGKNNVISPTTLAGLNQALDLAHAENAIVILTGREQIFSAGFDLGILKTGISNTISMLIGGFKLAHRLLRFPTPIIAASNGHAIAMGAFILLSADYRLGVTGDYKYVANEVKIGLTLPYSATVLCSHRLAPTHSQRSMLLAQTFNPNSAINAGFLDQVVDADKLLPTAMQLAQEYKTLDLNAHYNSKLRLRKPLLRKLQFSIYRDAVSFAMMGAARAINNLKTKA